MVQTDTSHNTQLGTAAAPAKGIIMLTCIFVMLKPTGFDETVKRSGDMPGNHLSNLS